MSGWAGFSDDELRRMQRKTPERPVGPPGSPPPAKSTSVPRKSSSAPRSLQQRQRDRALRQAGEEALQAGQRLSGAPPGGGGIPEEEKEAGRSAAAGRPEVKLSPAAESEQSREEAPEVRHSPTPESREKAPVVRHSPAPEVRELDQQEVEEVLRTRLQVLQQQQNLIENQNRVKKELLTRTLREKNQQTRAEAAMLEAVGAELRQLDSATTDDIIILRQRIEAADWEYTKARKRYARAEAEFVSAKEELHQRAELKEQLVEHLTAVVQQRELRKARKLEELMLKLALRGAGPGEEDVENGAEPEVEERAELKQEAEELQCS